MTRDLNFNDTDSYSSIAHKITWTMGEGWQPVGDSFFNAFTGKFEGNDFTISNLTIGRNGTNEIGLFGYTGGGAEITNVGLLNVNIIGSFGVGGLVGSNAANITNSYVAGSVSGNSNVGGLVGSNAANITNSYVAGSVSGNSNVGGLVGENRNGTITNSYATGSVSGDGSDVGGLVGENRDGTITNSYATSSVSEDGSDVGGLVGDNQGGTIMESYWDEQTSERTTSDGGDGKTTLALQEPTTATGIYSGWGTEVWDFGTSSQYPILKSADSDILLSGQGVGLRDLEVLTSGARLTSIFGATTTHYVISFLATRTSDITLRLKAYNTDATIRVVRQGEDNNYFDEKSSDGRSELIPIDVNTALVITVTEADTETTIYMISFQVETNTAPTIMIAPSLPQTLPVNSTAHIVVSVADDNFNVGHSVTLMAKSSSRTIVSVTTSMETDNITTDTSITFTLTAKQSGEATITFTATDSGELSDSVELPVRVNAILMISNVPMDVNTTPTLSGVPTEPIRLLEGTETTRNITINDADVDDSLSVRIDTSDSMIATTTIIATDGATRTLEVRGVGAGRAMITVTVNDGRGATNSAASEQFEVQVEANTTPTIMITPSLCQTLPVNSTAHIVVSVMDDNFNLDDIVTLEAMSSSQTIVSVTTSAETDDITTDTSITFTLTAKQNGEAVITFTATDSGKLSDSGAVSVEVNAPPTITSFDDTVLVKEGRERAIAVLVSDADTDDSLTLVLTAMDENQDVVELVTTSVTVVTNGSVARDAQTLKIKGLKAGMATLNITVSDEHTESAPVSVLVTVERNTPPTLSGVPTEPIRLLEGTETTRNITINDADVDDSLSVRIDTSDSMIATTTIIATDGATRTLEVRGVGAGRAMITVTVNDGRGATNSAASEQFEVQVEANTTPTIMITPSLGQTLPVNSTAHIVVSVMDDNFNLDDIVTLEAMSSSQTIVSVTTSAETDDITTDTSITFMLTAKRSGEAVITFTATDSGKLSDSGAVSVRVHIAIRIHVKVFLEGLLQ